VRAIRLPSGRLLIITEADDPDRDFDVAEIGPDHPDYGRWLAVSEEGESPRQRKGE